MTRPATIRSTDYIYRDAEGKPVYKIVRSDLLGGDKTFDQWRHDGKTYRKGIAGVPRVPYHLPEVLNIKERGGVVFKVEGEKCADRLNKAFEGTGLAAVATCNNGGAANWTDEQSAYLAEVRVCILPDNDASGERDVLAVAKRLKGIASSIKVVRLPGLGHKEDIYDWLEAKHTLDELRALYRAAPEYEHPPDAPLKPIPARLQAPTGERPAWIAKRLDKCAKDLAESKSRNITLNAVSYSMGRVAAHGLITREEVLNAFEIACDSNRYIAEHSYRAFEDTFNSGFNKGLTIPCTLYENTKRPKTAESFTTEQTWMCVPTIVRGLSNAYVYPATGNIQELIVEGQDAGLLEIDQWIDESDLQKVSDKLGRGLSLNTIRRGLKEGANPHSAEFVSILLDYKSVPVENRSEDIDTPLGKIDKNPLGGRPSDKYKLLPVEQILRNIVDHVMAPLIEKVFPQDSDLVAPIMADFVIDLLKDDAESTVDNLIDQYGKVIVNQPGYAKAMKEVRRQHQKIMRLIAAPVFAPIPKGMTYKNSSEYQACCALALVLAGGGETQISKTDLLLFIGCSERNLKTVLKRAGIESLKDQFVDVEAPLDEIKSLKLDWNTQVRGFPIAVMSSRREAAFDIERRGLDAYCEGEVKAGATLSIRYRQANRQRIMAQKSTVASEPKIEAQVPEVVKKPRLIDAPKRERKAKEVKETYAQAYQRKLVNLVAKSKNIPIERDGKLIVNKATGSIQLPLDFLLNRETDAEIIAPALTGKSLAESMTPAQKQSKDTADIVQWMLDDLGGTVSAVYDRGSAEYERCAR